MELARYASHSQVSRGRRHAEPPAPTRDAYQRDRDRIVHSTAFRRLVYKTQVFLNHEGDLFRTRMTHSLEVAQLARSIARALALNEDLTEAIALAHDLGHTPFGHAGQEALDRCLRKAAPDSAGFEHNLQSLRVVDRLEERYAAFDGLNLSFETREGILKHCSRRNAVALEADEPGGVGRRFLDGSQPGLEAQLCNLADEIAYNAHDLDDGVRSGLITVEQLEGVPLVARHLAAARAEHPGLVGRRLLYEMLRRLLSAQVLDVIAATRLALSDHAPHSVERVRALPALLRFSDAMRAESTELKRFLFAQLYRHPQVHETSAQAQAVIGDLFSAYAGGLAPAGALRPDVEPTRAVADYIAGMTDRYALREHHRLTGHRVFPSMG
ncbi:deoxyguanosinetriphosphate triphosphohydrolase [uncultured Methylibium sp.]|uniref:deoxyguanosinetriphosphate triphosphohydrolase n=1 Tax=uncultured Methylibium sp. TaxID=381093 RepID=UPI0025EA5760|nr:deoxyguanosinetriphosphate triphosphohydrolase [uncultured Methylibium sp.]